MQKNFFPKTTRATDYVLRQIKLLPKTSWLRHPSAEGPNWEAVSQPPQLFQIAVDLL